MELCDFKGILARIERRTSIHLEVMFSNGILEEYGPEERGPVASSQLTDSQPVMLERETGVEPATSSLGNQKRFVHRETWRPWRLVLAV
jgi:hypothetical protein